MSDHPTSARTTTARRGPFHDCSINGLRRTTLERLAEMMESEIVALLGNRGFARFVDVGSMRLQFLQVDTGSK